MEARIQGEYQRLREQFDRHLTPVIMSARRGRLTLRELQRGIVRRVIILTLQENNFNQCAAARDLGVHRNVLARTMLTHGISPQELRGADTRKPAAGAGFNRPAEAGAAASA